MEPDRCLPVGASIQWSVIMNDKSQASSRKDGFGTQGIGEDGDGSIGTTGSSAGSTGTTGHGGNQRGGHKVEGASGEEKHGAPGRRSLANKQGLDGNIQTD
jgi:hypothetical protein